MEELHACGNQYIPVRNGPHHGRGPTSYWMHDPEMVFRELDLKFGDVFLDLGCGPGDYALHAARLVGDRGRVCAVDREEDRLDTLRTRIRDAGLTNVEVISGDICDPLPIGNSTIDVCLLSTVLHCIDHDSGYAPLFREIRRVMKPGGRLCIIECKKEEMPFGPPLSMRVSAGDLEAWVPAYGFHKDGLTDLGYNYLIRFVPVE